MRTLIALLGALVCSGALVAGAFAQERGRPGANPASQAAASAAGASTPAWVKGRLAAAESDKAIPDEVRAQVVQLYREALIALDAAQAHREAAAEYRRASERAAARGPVPARSADAATQRGPARPDIEGLTDRTTIDELEQRLIVERAVLAGLQKESAEIGRRLAAEAGRPVESRAELGQARAAASRLESLAPPVSDEPRALADARRTLAAARRDEQLALIERLEQEIQSHAARVDLLEADRDRVAAALARQSARVDALDQLLFERRSEAARLAQAEARGAREQAVQRYPALDPVARRGVEIGERLTQIAQRTRAVGREAEAEEKALAHLESEFERLRPQLTGADGTTTYGQALFVYREQLARMSSRDGRRRAVLDEVSRLGFELQRIEDERHALLDLPVATERTLAAIGLDRLAAGPRAAAAETVLGLLREQRGLLDDLIPALQGQLRLLSDLATTLGTIDARTGEIRTAIDSRLLWTRTIPPVGWDTVAQLPGALARALGVDAWVSLARSMAAAPGLSWSLAAVVAALAGLLVAARARLARAIERIAARTPGSTAEGMRWVVAAMLASVALAVPVPALLMAASGLSLSSHPDTSARGLEAGLAAAGAFLLWAELTRQVFRPGGLARAHFGWPAGASDRVWRVFRWSAPLCALLTLAAVSAAAGPVGDRHSLGRVAYALVGLVSAYAMHRVLHHSPASDAAPFHGQRVWYVFAVLVPASFALLPMAGYGFTAVALGARVLSSYWFVGAVLLLLGLADRWLSLRVANEARGGADPSAGPSDDVRQMERSARFLLRGGADFAFVIGLWWIWSSLLPVLRNATGVQLWSKVALVTGAQTEVPVTLADLFLAAMVVLLTVVAARNIPGALKILMKSTVRADASLRTAFSTVAQYLIVGVGTFSALTILGADWSKLQWLVAALGVGLGFGLQEIVANFVCGLILLFERPIRPGDVVTVGEVTGTVTRISIRATHITDFDRKSVVVPNKALITDKVINWTLSDQLTRLVIPVGVAYGSDPERARRLLLEVALGLPGVLRDPSPTVHMARFGESSLDFEVRLFVDRFDARLSVTHDFHVAAERALRENGIEIPFPQRDLRVRSWPAGAQAGERPSDRPASA